MFVAVHTRYHFCILFAKFQIITKMFDIMNI